MSGIRTQAAATMLGVSPNTLRSWERRYGFPRPQRSPGNHRRFRLTEIEALRQALAETHNVSSAISLARARGEGPSSSLRLASAFAHYDETRADRLLEESLALRSVERTVEEVLLPAVAAHLIDSELTTPASDFAWRYATGWLWALGRLAPPVSRVQSVLVLDATVRGDFDAIHAQALELVLRRAGLRTVSVTAVVDPPRLGHSMRGLAPAAVVLTGRRASLETLGRLVHAVRGVAPAAIICDYRGAVADGGGSAVCRLGDSVVAACDRLVERLGAPAPSAPSAAASMPPRTAVPRSA
jgi:DNA-binding transcriptional MerR regulator